MDTEPQLIETVSFSRQKSTDRTSCSAHSLVNAVILAGGTVNNGETESLLSKIATNNKPLNNNDVDKFIEGHGLTPEHLFSYLQDLPRPFSIDSINEALLTKLQSGPFIMSIASELSLRDRSVEPILEFADRKANSHAVVAKLNENDIDVIDPYDPENIQKFNIDNPQQRIKFIALFTSPRARQILLEQDNNITGEEILNESIKRITSGETSARYLTEALSFTDVTLIKRN